MVFVLRLRKLLHIKWLRGEGRRKCLMISNLWRLIISESLSRLFENFFFIFLCNFLLTAQVVRVYLAHANTQATRRTHRLIVYT
jgi:hypothetical protein